MAEEDIKTHDAMNSLLGSWGRLLFYKPVSSVFTLLRYVSGKAFLS